jgi:hypothetical protein
MCEADWALIAKFTKILLSAPPLATTVALIIIFLFKSEIKNLINRVRKAAGMEFNDPQADGVQNEPREAFGEHDQTTSDTANKVGIAQPQGMSATISAGAVNVHIQEPFTSPVIYLDQAIEYDVSFLHSLNDQLRFERIFSRIYGTQIELLIFLMNKDSKSINSLEASLYYGRHLSLTDRRKYTQADYLEFLIKNNLISSSGKNAFEVYKATSETEYFLQYIAWQYPNNWKAKPY